MLHTPADGGRKPSEKTGRHTVQAGSPPRTHQETPGVTSFGRMSVSYWATRPDDMVDLTAPEQDGGGGIRNPAA